MTAAEINTRTVISAVWSLHSARARWPTAAEVAVYLEAPEADIRKLLRELKAARLFRDRRRSNRVVWGPWDPTEFMR